VADADGKQQQPPRSPGEIISLVLLVVGAVAIVIVFVIVGRALG